MVSKSYPAFTPDQIVYSLVSHGQPPTFEGDVILPSRAFLSKVDSRSPRRELVSPEQPGIPATRGTEACTGLGSWAGHHYRLPHELSPFCRYR